MAHMVPFLKFNPAETTSAWALQGRGQVQQKPNSVKGPVVEAEHEENPSAGEMTRSPEYWKPGQ